MSRSWPRGIVPLRLKQQQQFSCSFCRVRKLKVSPTVLPGAHVKYEALRNIYTQCDGVPPACSSCSKHHRADTCSLRGQQHGQEQDYPEYLNRRIQSLEERLTGHLPEGEVDEDESMGLTKSVNEVDAESLELPSELKRDFSLSEIIIASACVGMFSEGEAQNTGLSLPQKDAGSKLIQYYLEHIHAMNIPFVTVQSIWTQFDLVYSSPREAGACHNDYNTACFNVLMAMAIATTSLSQNGHSIIYETSKTLFRQATRIFGNYQVNPATLIETTEGILFLIQYGMLNPSNIDVRHLINVGVRMCFDLQLQRNLRTDAEVQQVSTRLHWAMYHFDRTFCIARLVPCALPEEGWQLQVYEEHTLYHKQRCRIIQLQSIIFDQLYMDFQVTSHSVENLATRLATWDLQNSQISVTRPKRLLRAEYCCAMILLYRPCQTLKKRSAEELLHLWNYSLEFAQIQYDCAGEILNLATSAEWAFITGIALIYCYKEIVHDHQYATNVAAVRISVLWAGVQNVNHVLWIISQQWAGATNILHKFEHIVEESMVAVESLMNGLETIPFPSDVNDIWRHASVTNDLPLERIRINGEREKIGELVRDIVHSSIETGQQRVN